VHFANNFGTRQSNLAKLVHVMCRQAGLKIWIQFFLGGAAALKVGSAKNVQNLARFRTTFDFDREYLWNGSRYQKSEKNKSSTTTPPTLEKNG